MKRWQWAVVTATVVAAAWVVYRKITVRKGRPFALQNGEDTAKKRIIPNGVAPQGVPNDAYEEACNVVSAGGVPHSEFRIEQGEVMWRHSLLEHYFDAVWVDGNHWLLVGLIKRDDTETPIPADLNTVIRDFNVLVADLQAHELEPRPAGWL